MIQKQAFVMTLVNMFAHTHKCKYPYATPEAQPRGILLIKTIDKPTVVVLDNAPIHRCQAVYARIEQWQAQDLYIFFLPKYSPHLNAIEILWRKMKYKWLKPEYYKSWSRLTKGVKSVLKNFGTEYKIHFQNSSIPL